MEKKQPEEGNTKKRYSIDEAEDNANVKEPAVDYGKKLYTVEEYLEMERASDVKHEYYQGEIFAMSGASDNHNWMFTNVFGKLYMQMRGKPCRPYGSDMRMHIPENTLYTYPDISIYCQNPNTIDGNSDNKINPTIIIELLSPSTRAYDLGKKFDLYRAIPTLKEYLLIDTERIGAKSWRINMHNYWAPEEYKTLQQSVLIPTVGISLSMKDIYDGVRFNK